MGKIYCYFSVVFFTEFVQRILKSGDMQNTSLELIILTYRMPWHVITYRGHTC